MCNVYRFLVVVCVVAAGCGSGDIVGGGGDGGAGASDAGEGDSCVTANNCADGQVCDPQTMTCVTDLACTNHSDCGAGGFCNAAGACEENVTGGPCDDATNCPSGNTCISGFCGCTGDQFLAEGVPPNLMIVLDRSGSMDNDGGNNMTKWEIAVSAVGILLNDFADAVRFGLVLYQGPGDCEPGQVEVDVGDMTEAAILAKLNTNPNGFTPIGDTLDALIDYPGLEDTTRDNYILLLTDGQETCDGDGVTAVTNLAAQDPVVKTFVVGFGGGVDANELNAMAMAGGTALSNGPPYYYQADDAASLQAAFSDIGAAVLSCTYDLSGEPDPNDIHVHFDGDPIGQDITQMDGWDYDPSTNQITFYGSACDALRTGDVTDLVIVSGCFIAVP